MKRAILLDSEGTVTASAEGQLRDAGDMAAGSASPAAERSRGPQLSVVVPTFKESGSIAELCRRLEAVLGATGWEVVFVDDDSPDGTAALGRSLAQADARVRCIQRIGRRGLSSACVEGILASSAPIVAVMDADLQHDETALPKMVELVRSGEAELAVGTRYAQGGSTGDWDASREKMSRTATWLSHVITGVHLSDPMSGFFVIKREKFEEVVRGLSGLGFKILLDIAATAKKDLKVAEVPYEFRLRQAGESKLDSQVLWEFLLLLIDKRIGKWVPARFVSFAAIGGMGVVVHFAVLTAMFQLIGEGFALSQTVAAVAAMVFNYSLNNVLTYRDRRRTGWRWLTGLVSFIAVCAIGAAANVGVASYLFEEQSTGWVLSALAGILMGAVWNYAVSSVYTWRK
jgi:dolichol-phosphate mannosyltransferase